MQQEDKVLEVRQDQNGVQVITSSGAEFRARYCVVACGVNERLLSFNGFNYREPSFSRCAVSYLVKAAAPERIVSIIAKRGGECYLTPLSEDSINVALLSTGKISEVWGSEAARELSIREMLRALSMQVSHISDPIGASALGRSICQPSMGRIFVTGDALRSFDPIGGMGMTHALGTGIVAAESLAAVLYSEISPDNARECYREGVHRLARSCAGMTMFSGQFVQRLSMIPGISLLAKYLGGPAHRFIARRCAQSLVLNL